MLGRVRSGGRLSRMPALVVYWVAEEEVTGGMEERWWSWEFGSGVRVLRLVAAVA